MATSTLDPYATLGIPLGASREEAGRAHRRLAKAYHPDVNDGPASAERMRRINEAWRILSDPARRARYDAGRVAAQWSGSASHGTPRPERWGASSYGPRPGTSSWATWPESRQATDPRSRRPPRAESAAPSFGDRPMVVVAVWITLSLLFFVGTWLGSLAP